MDVKQIAQDATAAALIVASSPTEMKNAALENMANKLAERKQDILAANNADMQQAEEDKLPRNLIDRLKFGEAKIDSRINSLRKIKELPDPVGQRFNVQDRPNGLHVERVRVPLGVIMMIYEARPHVTVNAGAFCLKSGNAAILRGGSDARNCNKLLGELWRESLAEAGLAVDAVQVISSSHDEIDELLQLDEYINLVIPRGGKRLIQSVASKSKIPVVKHFAGLCHVYIDENVDIARAIDIALDSKCLMPEVCNAMETLLVSETVLDQMPRIVDSFRKCGVTVKGCEKTQAAAEGVEPATEEDWRTEYLDNIVSIRVVSNVAEAVDHINLYGSHHTDSIVTNDPKSAEEFTKLVDSGVVLVNASTMFCDGESLGMGAEIGISTDKIHARGPMGLEELTSYKFVIKGNGHVMGNPSEFVKK